MIDEILDVWNSDSYSDKVEIASEAFKELKDYYMKYMSSSKAYDSAMAIALSFFASDYSLSGTEVIFFNDFLGKGFEPSYLAGEYRNFKSEGLLKQAQELAVKASESVRKSALILAAMCLICDRKITDTEREDFNGFAELLQLTAS